LLLPHLIGGTAQWCSNHTGAEPRRDGRSDLTVPPRSDRNGSTYTYAGRGTTRFISKVRAVEGLTTAVYSGWSTDSEQEEPVSFLSRAFGVQPHRAYAVRVQRDLVIPASDGVPLLANRFYPADIDRPPLVLLRSPYGRGVALDRMPQLLAERGYQVLYQSLRATAGSSGEFDGFTINPADGDGMLWWLREQPWFGGVLATWGASYWGFASGSSPPARSRNGRSVIQDAPSEFAHQFMYPGGGFALGNALGWVQIVDRMFRADVERLATPGALAAESLRPMSIRSPEQPVHRQARSVTAASRKQQVANRKSRYDHAPAAVRDCAAR
jgi:predicted acyl esterase